MSQDGSEHVGHGRVGLWVKLRRDRSAFVGMMLLAVLLATAVASLPFALRWYNVQELSSAVRHRPSATPVVPFASYEREATGSRGAARAAYHLTSVMGHDDLGRSLFFRIAPALLVSLGIGLAAAVMATGIGTAWGAVAAYAGGRVDLVMMRIVDVLYGLPYILMVILLKTAIARPLTAMLGGHAKYADLVVMFLAIGGVAWLTMARVVRGQVLSLRQQPFIEAARATGAGPIYILWRHVLPNLVGPIVVYATLVVPQAVLQESFLSFLGIGVQQPTPSLGRLAADGVEAVNTFVSYWWLLIFPCGVLVVTLLALNFVGEGLRNALDPKSRAAPLL